MDLQGDEWAPDYTMDLLRPGWGAFVQDAW
jgi:hypothetical protein